LGQGRNLSLISHLHLRDGRMLSTSRGHGDYRDYLSYRLDLTSPTPVAAVPMLGTEFQMISFNEWWCHEPVFVHDGHKYSERPLYRVQHTRLVARMWIGSSRDTMRSFPQDASRLGLRATWSVKARLLSSRSSATMRRTPIWRFCVSLHMRRWRPPSISNGSRMRPN
jgi:hypothetical protein